MRTILPIAAALVLAAAGTASAAGGITIDRVSMHAAIFGSVGQASALEAASQAADAKMRVVETRP